MKRKAVQREIAVLKKVNHPNIIKLHEIIDTHKQINLVTEFIGGQSLQQIVKFNGVFRKMPE